MIGHAIELLPGVVDFVSGCVISGHPLASLGRRLQLPVVDLVEKHLSKLYDCLTFLGWQVAEFVLDKIVHPLFGKCRERDKKKKKIIMTHSMRQSVGFDMHVDMQLPAQCWVFQMEDSPVLLTLVYPSAEWTSSVTET